MKNEMSTIMTSYCVNNEMFAVCLQDCDFDPLKYNSIIECEKPNNDLNRFRGYMWVLSCMVHHGDEQLSYLLTHVNISHFLFFYATEDY